MLFVSVNVSHIKSSKSCNRFKTKKRKDTRKRLQLQTLHEYNIHTYIQIHSTNANLCGWLTHRRTVRLSDFVIVLLFWLFSFVFIVCIKRQWHLLFLFFLFFLFFFKFYFDFSVLLNVFSAFCVVFFFLFYEKNNEFKIMCYVFLWMALFSSLLGFLYFVLLKVNNINLICLFTIDYELETNSII